MLAVPSDRLNDWGRIAVRIFPQPEAMFEALARFTADFIQKRNVRRQQTTIIFPLGPKKHYPRLAEICNCEGISWRSCRCFNTDEWLDWQCRPLPLEHPFSLEGYMRRNLYDRLDKKLRPPERNLVFPSPRNFLQLSERLERGGGADIMFGGFGYTGHLAFNEPPTCRWYKISAKEFCNSRARILHINDESLIAHANRSLGGNTRAIPPMAVTLGMKDLLASKKLVLVSDGGAWKQTTLRILLFHKPTVEYPCTFVQGHRDSQVWVDAKTAACPPSAFTG